VQSFGTDVAQHREDMVWLMQRELRSKLQA